MFRQDCINKNPYKHLICRDLMLFKCVFVMREGLAFMVRSASVPGSLRGVPFASSVTNFIGPALTT